MPFLDHRLAEFVATIPQKYKSSKRPKGLLLKALAGKLPIGMETRSKRGFTFPFSRWLVGPWRKEIESLLLADDRSKILSSGPVNDIWQAFLRGQLHWSRPWALYVLKRWMDATLNPAITKHFSKNAQNH